jgi:hypothetical protein
MRHKKQVTKEGLNKGNILRTIASDDHVIDIDKKNSPTTRRCVDKQVMVAGWESINSHHGGETLKLGAWDGGRGRAV